MTCTPSLRFLALAALAVSFHPIYLVAVLTNIPVLILTRS